MTFLAPERAFRIVCFHPRVGCLLLAPAEARALASPAYPGAGLEQLGVCRLSLPGSATSGLAADRGPARVHGIGVNNLPFPSACQTGEAVCLDAVQTPSGYGYMADHGLEKRQRDSKSLAALTGAWLSDALGVAV